MEAAPKSQLLFSRHQEALEETPPLIKASTSTLACNAVTVGGTQPPHLARPSRQEPLLYSLGPRGSLPGCTVQGGWAGGLLGTSQRPVNTHPWALG